MDIPLISLFPKPEISGNHNTIIYIILGICQEWEECIGSIFEIFTYGDIYYPHPKKKDHPINEYFEENNNFEIFLILSDFEKTIRRDILLMNLSNHHAKPPSMQI